VPNILTEPVVQDPPLEPVVAPPRSWTWLPKSIVLLLVFIWLLSLGISFLIRHTSLQGRLTGRLEKVFGRHVEVGRYDFSLWGGPTLEAQAVTLAEDPRFGHEYFLRAESLTVRLRWQSLLRGHMELGRILLRRPSLNLVRNEAGDWNLAEWLPRPATLAFPTAATNANASPYQPAYVPATQPTVRFTRIEVDSGRINFKRGYEKSPFAFISVDGYVEPDGPGRWRVNLEATPTRAAVVLQSPGTIFLSGSLGGTSSRLRPASLDLAWSDASISDVLRLFRGDDFGVRGSLAAALHAETEGDTWNLQAQSQLHELHRWDLPLRSDNPAVDIIAKMALNTVTSVLDVSSATIEAASSSAHASAQFDWSGAPKSSASVSGSAVPNQIQIFQTQIGLNDVLAWLRAFHSDVASDVALAGTANVSADLQSWPLQVVRASATITSAQLTSPRLRLPAHLSQFQLLYDHRGASIAPALLYFGAVAPEAASGSFHLESTAGAAPHDRPGFRLFGNLPQARDLIATAGALGWNISRGWDLAGPLRCDLHWHGDTFPWKSQPTGNIEWGADEGNASLLTPFLNQPVQHIRARADLKPDSRHITLSAAEAFGAHWTGTFDNHADGEGWQFALSTGQLDISDLDRWLNPRWRESLIYRVLPFLNPNSPSNSVPENLRAAGRLSIDEFTVGPIALKHLQEDLRIGGRHLEVANAKAQFFGGTLEGSLDAQLAATPVYRIAAEYSHVDLAALTAESPTLASLFAGYASGDIALHFSGASPGDLLSSLRCSGTTHVIDPELRLLNLSETLRAASLRPGASSFREATASFTCAEEKINFGELLFDGASQEVQGAGDVSFDRTLNLQLSQTPTPSYERGSKSSTQIAADSAELIGPLAKPSVRRIEAPPSRP
jgi:AsmA-like C-terminal region/AsmA family